MKKALFNWIDQHPLNLLEHHIQNGTITRTKSGCWLARYSNGNHLSQFWFRKKVYTPQRFSMEFLNGVKISKDVLLKTMCGTFQCMNPDHLTVVASIDYTDVKNQLAGRKSRASYKKPKKKKSRRSDSNPIP